MPRKNREWYPDVMMHITSRGNRRNDIFKDEEDYKVYLGMIEFVLEKLDWQYEVVCYMLMTNHVHLQVQTKEKHIKYFVGRLNNLYAKYFNNKYNYVGHLFQERYGSELILTDRYALEASRYIHLNPVRANMVNRPEDYKWGSYRMYMGKEKEKIINTEKILSYFQDHNRELYIRYVERETKVTATCRGNVNETL